MEHSLATARAAARFLLRERGQSLIEFAMVMPFLVVFIFVMVDLGVLFGRYNTINHAAAEGARLGAIGGGTTAILDRIRGQSGGDLDALGNCGANDVCAQLVTGPNAESPGQVGSSIRVRVDHPFQPFLSQLPFLSALPDWPVKSCALHRVEKPVVGITDLPIDTVSNAC